MLGKATHCPGTILLDMEYIAWRRKEVQKPARCAWQLEQLLGVREEIKHGSRMRQFSGRFGRVNKAQ